MNWLILVAIAVLSDSTRIFIDNYVSDTYFKGREAASQKLFYGYCFTIVGIIVSLISGVNPSISPTSIALIAGAGFFSALAGVAYYRALELDDSTNIGIFTQLSPVFYLILGWFFLDQSFSPMQLIAFIVILSAPFLIIATTKKRSRHIRIKAVLYAFLYVLIAVTGNLLFVKAGTTNYNFIQDLAILFFFKGLSGILIVYSYPKFRRRFYAVVKRSHHKVLRPMSINFIIGIIKEFSYRGALAAAPAVALASVASDSAEPIFIFFLGLLLTLIWPKFGREKLDRKTIIVHLMATVLVVIGIVLLQM